MHICKQKDGWLHSGQPAVALRYCLHTLYHVQPPLDLVSRYESVVAMQAIAGAAAAAADSNGA